MLKENGFKLAIWFMRHLVEDYVKSIILQNIGLAILTTGVLALMI
jgi:hypothetical protein